MIAKFEKIKEICLGGHFQKILTRKTDFRIKLATTVLFHTLDGSSGAVKNLSPLVNLSMTKTMVAIVINELKITRLQSFTETGPRNNIQLESSNQSW